MSTQTPFELTALDGRILAADRFEPDGEARGTVVLLPAYAVRRQYYRRFASWLADRGFCVLTFDPRGIGDSLQGHVKDEPASATDWALLDHGAALEWLADQPGPHLAVAHSFGGQILGITEGATCLDGMYAVASQLGWWGYQETALARLRMRLLTRAVMPTANRMFGYLPGWTGIGEDVPPRAMAEWIDWMATPAYLLDHVPDADARYRRWPGQLALVGFTDDDYAPPRGVEALGACFSPERTELRILQPSDVGQDAVGHFGFFRPHANEVMWHDALTHLGRWSTEP